MEESGSGLKLLRRKKIERVSNTSEVIVMAFEGVMGGWIFEQPGSSVLVLRSGYQESLCELSQRAKIVFIIDSRGEQARKVILDCL